MKEISRKTSLLDSSEIRVILASILERGGNIFPGDREDATSVPTRQEESEE